jgi:hypothetical protein
MKLPMKLAGKTMKSHMKYPGIPNEIAYEIGRQDHEIAYEILWQSK